MRFDPTSAGRSRNLMKQVLSPGSYPNDKLRQAIEQWEKIVRTFEGKRGADGQCKNLDEDIKIGVLQEMVKEKSLQDHLYLRPLGTYANARKEIFEYLERKTRPDDGGVIPMDLGYFQKGGGGGKNGGKGAQGNGDPIKCRNCGKTGHKQSECWAPGGGQERKPQQQPSRPQQQRQQGGHTQYGGASGSGASNPN